MHKETLASEIIKDMQNEKRAMMMELECFDTDFEKAQFILNEAIESLEQMGVPETREEGLIQHCNIRNIDMKLGIAFDYIVKLRNAIGDIVIRESKKNKKIQEYGEKDGL